MAGRSRLLYVDWLRGVAVLCMILWHSVDAWIDPAARTGPVFAAISFFGGWAAPMFLFLAGVSVALAGEAAMSRSARPLRTAASWRLQKRGWQVFLLAHLFRVQSFLLNPKAGWSSVFKPDILNILGLGLVLAAFCWRRATTRLRAVVWLLAPAVVVMLMTPASRRWTWTLVLRPYVPRLEAYIHPVAGIGVFAAFPWLAYVLAGTFIGTFLVAPWSGASTVGQGDDRGRFQAGLAAAGLGIVLAGVVGSQLPSITGSDFWTTSLSLFFWRIGLMTLGMPIAWAWLKWTKGHAGTPLVVFGRASLFVYWVHVELAYGFFTYPIRASLPVGWAIAAFLMLTAFMFLMARLWMGRRHPAIPPDLRVQPSPEASAASS